MPGILIQLAVADCLYDTADLSVYEKNANILYDALTGMGFEIVRPGGTFYMFPKAPEPDAVAFCKRAMKQDLLLVPGDTFGCPGYFRMAYCIETEKVETFSVCIPKTVKEIREDMAKEKVVEQRSSITFS